MPNTPNIDRELHMLLTISGHQNRDGSVGQIPGDPNSLQYAYTYVSAVPGANSAAVASDGDIDLTQMQTGSNYTRQVDIYIAVTGSITGNDGNLYPVRFAKPGESSGSNKEIGFCWRVNNETQQNVVPWPNGMSVSRDSNGLMVTIYDDGPGNSGLPYYYCLGIAIDNIAGLGTYYYITFDPKIINPG